MKVIKVVFVLLFCFIFVCGENEVDESGKNIKSFNTPIRPKSTVVWGIPTGYLMCRQGYLMSRGRCRKILY